MMRVVNRVALVLVLAAAAACTTDSPPAKASAPTITVASVNGSGCPAGTATATVTGSAVTVTYTSFTASAGTGVSPILSRRNCLISMAISAPGRIFAVTSATEHGTVSVPAGGTVLQRHTYYLQGTSANTVVDHPASGPLSGAWDKTDTAPYAAPCGTTRNLNLNVDLRVTSPGPSASLSLNGATPGTTINLAFTNCP
jgi:hypothetical protein